MKISCAHSLKVPQVQYLSGLAAFSICEKNYFILPYLRIAPKSKADPLDLYFRNLTTKGKPETKI